MAQSSNSCERGLSSPAAVVVVVVEEAVRGEEGRPDDDDVVVSNNAGSPSLLREVDFCFIFSCQEEERHNKQQIKKMRKDSMDRSLLASPLHAAHIIYSFCKYSSCIQSFVYYTLLEQKER
jgi:hypothetical protein